MINGLNLDERVIFTSTLDITEPKTQFTLRPISGFEMIELSASGELDLKRYLKQSIVSVSSVADKDNFIDSLPAGLIGELLKRLNELNGLAGQDEKN